MAYYVYENWTAEHKAVIHIGTCGFCKEGKGCHENPLGNKNMALLIHLKKQKEQQKIRVDQFASIAVYEFNDKNVRS